MARRFLSLFHLAGKHIDIAGTVRVNRVHRTDRIQMYDRGPAEGVPVQAESRPAAALHSPDFYADDPYPAYRELRATAPVCWNDVTKFWALLKYEDVRYVSGNPALFSSAKGITIP